jgi:hypothetical protein
MSLADDIYGLRDRTLAELAAAHNYYVHTKIAWELVRHRVEAGGDFSAHNKATGSRVTAAELAGLARGYVTVQLGEATFVQFISVFETFFFDLLRLWLRTYPGSLEKKDVKFKTVLDAADREAVVRLVVDHEVNQVMYEKPAAWFGYLDGKAKLGCPTTDQVDRISEAKASRDVLVHNRGVVNRMYLDKAGSHARYRDGEPLNIPEPYHRQTWELLQDVVNDLAAAAVAKAA